MADTVCIWETVNFVVDNFTFNSYFRTCHKVKNLMVFSKHHGIS